MGSDESPSEQAGCVDDQGTVVDKCSTNVYGFSPTSLITNIAVISGLLSAIFMPIIGGLFKIKKYFFINISKLK